MLVQYFEALRCSHCKSCNIRDTTSGGLGAGLPGVKRLMDEFDIKSEEGEGTEIRAIKWLR